MYVIVYVNERNARVCTWFFSAILEIAIAKLTERKKKNA